MKIISALIISIALLAVGNDRVGGEEPSLIVINGWHEQGDLDVFTMLSDGSNVTRLTSDSRPEFYGELSPNGQEIVFVRFFSEFDGSQWDVYRMNVDGSNQTRLTSAKGPDYAPTWSPDGSKILFVSCRDSDFELYTMNRDGTNQQRLTRRKGIDGNPDWSPDGQKIVLNREERSQTTSSHALWTMDADGSNPQQITAPNLNEYYPKWSPDGSRLLFTGERPGMPRSALYTINRDGTNERRVSPSDGGYYSTASWSPDGLEIVYAVGYINDIGGIKVMNSDGTNIRKLLPGFDFPEWGTGN